MLPSGTKRNGRIERQSGPPGNMNAFKHALASIQKRREEGIRTQHEENVRQQIWLVEPLFALHPYV
jgi:hypothetical protein